MAHQLSLCDEDNALHCDTFGDVAFVRRVESAKGFPSVT